MGRNKHIITQQKNNEYISILISSIEFSLCAFYSTISIQMVFVTLFKHPNLNKNNSSLCNLLVFNTLQIEIHIELLIRTL